MARLQLASTLERAQVQERIAFHKQQGRAPSNRVKSSDEQVGTERQKWNRWCQIGDLNSTEALKKFEASVVKAYLEWRVKTGRITALSSIKSYWKRLSCAFSDLTGHKIQNGTNVDIRNWIPKFFVGEYNLRTEEKEKDAMYVQDFLPVLRSHWIFDTREMPGFMRLQLALLLLLSCATGTRPGALVESSSAKGTNKALLWKHVQIIKIRDPKCRERSTIIIKLELVNVKNTGKGGRRKRFVFRLEALPVFCLVSHFLGLALGHDIFEDQFGSVKDILDLKIPEDKDSLKIEFKAAVLDDPVFCILPRSADASTSAKALPYHKYRDHFVWLGRLAGFEQPLELYQLRRASGRNINSVLTAEERNQVMGHHGSTYQDYYLPDLIEEDFQAIYFGTTPQTAVIKEAARMGLTRDPRAPTKLSDEQKKEIKMHPDVDKLRRKAQLLKRHIKMYPKNDKAQTKYRQTKRCMTNMINKLQRQRLKESIAQFHKTINHQEIAYQLGTGPKPSSALRDKPRFMLPEREDAILHLEVELSSLPRYKSYEVRCAFISSLASLCQRQEGKNVNGRPLPSEASPIPLRLNAFVCLICMGKPFTAKTSLQRHFVQHFRNGIRLDFVKCPHPSCATTISNVNHYLHHAATEHGVFH